MPEHYGIGVNFIGGTIHLENQKSAEVDFTDSNGNMVSFTLAPRVTLTLLNSSSAPAHKVRSTKTGSVYTGFTVGFQSNQTVDIEWQASKRG